MNTIVNITGLTLKCLKPSDENVIKATYMQKWREKNRIKWRKYKKEWRLKNLKKAKLQEKRKREKYKIKITERMKIYYDKNKEYLKKYAKLYRKKNKEKINEKKKKYNKLYEQRLEVKIRTRLRKRIREALKNQKKSNTTLNLTGINLPGLKKHLESTFKKGMNWEKFKKGVIHIDHIRPCVSFDLSKPEEQAKCFHYTNLQALWAHENLSKGSKFVA